MSIFKRELFEICQIKTKGKEGMIGLRKVGNKLQTVDAQGESIRPASWRGLVEGETFVFSPSLSRR